MSELVLKKKSIKVTFNDKEYIVAKPNTRQINEFSKASDSSIDAIVVFLEKLGLPADITWEIDAEALQQIVEALIPKLSEKKS